MPKVIHVILVQQQVQTGNSKQCTGHAKPHSVAWVYANDRQLHSQIWPCGSSHPPPAASRRPMKCKSARPLKVEGSNNGCGSSLRRIQIYRCLIHSCLAWIDAVLSIVCLHGQRISRQSNLRRKVLDGPILKQGTLRNKHSFSI